MIPSHAYYCNLPNTILSLIEYRIAENLREFVKNMVFAEKTFADCSLLPCKRMPHPKFHGQNFHVLATKPQIRESFLPRKFSAIRYSSFLTPIMESQCTIYCFRRLWYYVTLCECRIMTSDTLACINMLCSLCYVPLVTGGTLLPTYHCPPGPTKPL